VAEVSLASVDDAGFAKSSGQELSEQIEHRPRSIEGVHWPLPPAFEPIREIGRGATSVVYEATQRSTGRALAIKLLTQPLSDPAASRRFTRECAAMAALAAHPNIVTIIDAGVHELRPWIAMELCRRGSYAAMGALPTAHALEVLIAVADALDAAHQLGILHCDLKPGNILMTDFGAPAIADFGIARPASSAATVMGSGYSLDQAAPEVLDGHEPSKATDVYCLGSTIWTLLSGRSPFRESATTPASTIAKRILLDPLPPPPDTTPPALAELLTSMTAKAPGDRIAGMTEISERARRIQVDLGLDTASRPLPLLDPAVIGLRAPAPAPGMDENTRYRAPRGAVPDLAEMPTTTVAAPPLGRRRRHLLVVLFALLLIAILGAIAAAVGMRSGTSVETPPPPARSSATPAAAPALDPLGIGVPELDPPCDGQFIVITGSAVRPGYYAEDVKWLLSTAPGAHYVQTARSCGVFADHTAGGALIYAVYLGPYPTLAQACAARAHAAPGAITRQLTDEAAASHPAC
jgi:hypothetical protein